MLVLFRGWTRKYVASWLQKTERACALLDLFLPSSSLWCEVFLYPFKMKKSNTLQSFPIDLMKPMHTLTSPSPWSVWRFEVLPQPTGLMLMKNFQRGVSTFFLLHRPPMPLYTAIKSLNFQIEAISDQIDWTFVYQAFLKVLHFLKIIFQTNCLDFNHKLRFRQAQLAALPGPHFSALLGARH